MAKVKKSAVRPAWSAGLRSSSATTLASAAAALVALAATLTAGPAGQPVRDLTPRGSDLALSALSGAPATSASTCADVLLLGTTGNAERPVPDRPGSMGPTLDVLADSYRASAAAGDRSVESRFIASTTLRTGALVVPGGRDRPAVQAITRGEVREWRGALGATIRRTLDALAEAAVRCPDQQIVLAGYSQGAMAMHRTLLRLEDTPATAARLAAAVLVGDGDRRAATRAFSVTGEPAAPESGQGVAATFTRPRPDVPVSGSSLRVWQVCARGDVVCDTRRTPFEVAARIHRGYAAGTAADVLATVGRRAFDRTSQWPLPDPVSRAVAVDLGTPLSKALHVRVRAADLDNVRWGDVTGLPPGVSLSSAGRLSGTPTSGGTYRVGYTVWNTTPGLGRRAAGEVVVTVRTPATVAISSGAAQSCEVRADGTAWCWGGNEFGQLGDGTTTTRQVPVRVGNGTSWATISTSGATTCATTTAGRAYCWGLNQWGQLGDTTRTDRRQPTEVAGTGTWSSVVTGWFQTCGIQEDGTAWCWGNNEQGQLGDGTRTNRLRPVRVAGGGSWRDLAAGGEHTCGVKGDGSLWCWGRNTFGELALSGGANRLQPSQVGSARNWVDVDASWSHTCGLRADGSAWCWGRNDWGQVGDGTVQDRTQPTPVSGDRDYAAISVGDSFSCALQSGGRLWCWGYNRYGQQGNQGQEPSRTPVAAGTGFTWDVFDAGWLHGCGVSTSGSTRCWGLNDAGQVGDGTLTTRVNPTATRGGGS